MKLKELNLGDRLNIAIMGEDEEFSLFKVEDGKAFFLLRTPVQFSAFGRCNTYKGSIIDKYLQTVYASIMEEEFYSRIIPYDLGGYERKIWLPSEEEYNAMPESIRGWECECVYDDEGDSDCDRCTKACVAWTRTPIAGNSRSVRHVYTDGGLNNGLAYDGNDGVRPAFSLPASLEVCEARVVRSKKKTKRELFLEVIKTSPDKEQLLKRFDDAEE